MNSDGILFVNQDKTSLNVIPQTKGIVCQWPWEAVAEWHRVLSLLGGIVSFVGIPCISPLLDKGGILICHVTAVFFTEAAFSPVCSRWYLNARYGPVTNLPVELNTDGKSLLRVHLSKETAVAIRFLLPPNKGNRLLLVPWCGAVPARSHLCFVFLVYLNQTDLHRGLALLLDCTTLSCW